MNIPISIYIQPYERREAIEAYEHRLTSTEIAVIEEAPDDAVIRLDFVGGAIGTQVVIIPVDTCDRG